MAIIQKDIILVKLNSQQFCLTRLDNILFIWLNLVNPHKTWQIKTRAGIKSKRKIKTQSEGLKIRRESECVGVSGSEEVYWQFVLPTLWAWSDYSEAFVAYWCELIIHVTHCSAENKQPHTPGYSWERGLEPEAGLALSESPDKHHDNDITITRHRVLLSFLSLLNPYFLILISLNELLSKLKDCLVIVISFYFYFKCYTP